MGNEPQMGGRYLRHERVEVEDVRRVGGRVGGSGRDFAGAERS